MMEIYAVKLDYSFNEPQFSRLLSIVGAEKQAQIKRFLRHEDALRALFAEILIRYIICSKLHINNNEIAFEKNQYGKPYVKHFSTFQYNISHSGEWVVCVIDNETVGIDIETIKPIDMHIAERFFSRDECIALFSKDEPARLPYFFDLWTLKESYIKAWGKGLSIPLDSFTMVEAEGKGFIVKTMNEFNHCYFKQYEIDSGYKLAVCALMDYFPENIIHLDVERLYGFFINS